MNERSNVYVFGTAARAYNPLPSYEERDERQRQIREERKKRTKTRTHVNPLTVLVVFITFALVMVSGIIYLNLNFQSTYLSKSVVKLSSEVVEMQKANDSLRERLEDSLNLNDIYKKATKELGMSPVKKSQIVTYDRKKSTEIRKYGEIPAN
ncbi:MAG: hypothetical protein K5639_03370 [Eubacterium sp.]|nr:hypothetical protein [Eubacterium sp.]